jgi:hypothetical protein
VCVAPSTQQCGRGGVECVACGPCQTCTAAGSCDIDPASTWDIVCVSAKLASTQPNGAAWDPSAPGPNGPLPDPFCQYERVSGLVDPSNAAVTSTITDTLTPMWSQNVTPAANPPTASWLLSSSTGWRLWVGDDDGCTASGCVAQEACEIDGPLPKSALETGTLVIENRASCVQLYVKFNCTAPGP